MDYVIGSVAALISGNVTPNRPKISKRPFTPTKHQPSPNVTPKSEFVEGRSIFLSPTQQKKKAIVKKSPKRIFQNPDVDVTEDSEGNSSLTSPKAEKVKKHLEVELEADGMGGKRTKLSSSTLDKSTDVVSPKKKFKIVNDSNATDSIPKKKKNKRVSEPSVVENDNIIDNSKSENVATSNDSQTMNKSAKKKHISITDKIEVTHTINDINKDDKTISNKIHAAEDETQVLEINQDETKKSKKKKKKSQQIPDNNVLINNKHAKAETATTPEQNLNKKKKKNCKNKTKQVKVPEAVPDEPQQEKMEVDNNQENDNNSESESEEVRSSNIPNPNAITEKDSESEHDSDDEIQSENEQANEKVLINEKNEQESSDEEEQVEKGSKKKVTDVKQKGQEVLTEEEIKRTLFVGNVPFSKKTKKEVKKIFSKYGQIDTIRIRTIPVKDARVTPKLAVIKNELHPERTTVNVYVKFANLTSVSKALSENNTVLNGNHLRVSRSDSTGADHDPRSAVFVGNLPFSIEDETLRSKFDKCGEISSVRIIRDKKTNAGKGFGYVNFTSKDGVELALALSDEDLTIKNRIIRVNRCTHMQKGNQGPPKQGERKRGGQQGGNKWGGQQGGNKWGGQQGGNKWGGQQGGNKWGGQQGGNKWGGQQGGNKWAGQQGGNKWGGHQGGNKWGGQQGESKFGQDGPDGAARRLNNKRKYQEASGDGPPNEKLRNVNQPIKEKKPRKEFVGVTAEKKKKQKFDKGLKKKKALSEILSK